jgi:hypothetical protein
MKVIPIADAPIIFPPFFVVGRVLESSMRLFGN